MGTKEENYRMVRASLQQARQEAERCAEQRKAEVYAEIPEIQEIDRALTGLGMELFHAATEGRGVLRERIAVIRKNNENLQADRAEMLRARGYPADYTEPHYQCALCGDTGYRAGKMCDCLRKALIVADYERSGLGTLLRTQSFDSFDLSFYPADKREHMARNLAICRDYAEQFDPKEGKSLLLYGATGLGKTHLSTSIARVVLDHGYAVIYETAAKLFQTFEESRFGRFDENDRNPTDAYFTCDLLILDDLGTEAQTQYSVSCLYLLLNTRINKGLGTIINTNLFHDDLYKKYQDRIVSRLFGTFRPLSFEGEDVRRVRMSRADRT